MINSGQSSDGSAVLELIVGVVIVACISVGVYAAQHPSMTQQDRVTAAFYQ